MRYFGIYEILEIFLRFMGFFDFTLIFEMKRFIWDFRIFYDF